MAYEKLNLQDGITLSASHLRHIEGGIEAATIIATGITPLSWADLNELDSESLPVVLEAAQPVLTNSVQSIFAGLADGASVAYSVDGVAYTFRRLGDVTDTLVYRDGKLQVCRKINDAGTELLGEYRFETVACSDLSTVFASFILPCSLENLLAGTVKQVSYADCGAYLDGTHDDYEAMYRAHYIGDLCSCDVIQHGGTIYKACSGWLYVNSHNVDLSGSVMKLDGYNRLGCYWLGGQTYYTTDGLDKSEVVQYATEWPSAETGYRANGLFLITRPADTIRWNSGEVTSEDRKEIVRHGMDGRVYSPVIDDALDTTEVLFTRYPETQQTFKGCTVDIDIAWGSVAMYFLRCERSNVVIRDFVINPTRRTTQNLGYRGAVFTLNNCADITLENIKGINIAGRPTATYPRGVAGYVLNAVCVLDLTVRDCNLLGYWGCIGLNGAKEVTFEGSELNRVDVHDYFANVTIHNCRIYGQTLNFGYGKGALNISDCQVLTDWVHQIVNLRCDYGRYFEGEINICNVDAVYTGEGHFDIVSGVTLYSEESAAASGLYMKRYPTINVSNVTMRLMGDSYAGYVFNMPAGLEETIEITDKRKVVEYANLTVYDANGDLQAIGECPISGVVKSPMQRSSHYVADATGDMVAVSDAVEQLAFAAISHIAPAQAGSGDPSPDNIRAITGHEQVSLYRAGHNLLQLGDRSLTRGNVAISVDKTGLLTFDGTSTLSSTGSVSLASMTLPAGTYTLSGTVIGGSMTNEGATIAFVDVDGTYYRVKTNALSASFTLSQRQEVSIGCMVTANGAVYEDYAVQLQLERGSEVTAWQPSAAVSIEAPLPETVYGGSIDWLAGEVTIDSMLISFDGTENWQKNATSANTVRLTTPAGAASVVAASHYLVRSTSNSANDMSTIIGTQLNFRDSVNAVDVDTWKAYLAAQVAAGTPVTIVCQMTKPYTIQLTPKQLTLLQGSNAVWSDAGDTALIYLADARLRIDQMLAATTTAAVASDA